jgi:hypothetical protein
MARLLTLSLAASLNLMGPASTAQLPASGVVADESSKSSIHVFNEVAVQETVGFSYLDFEMYHNPISGQISGLGAIDINRMAYSGSYPAVRPWIYGSADLSGSVTFSAKPVKRGSLISLAGAKIAATASGIGDAQIDYYGWALYDTFELYSKCNFTSRSLAIADTGGEPSACWNYLRRQSSYVGRREWHGIVLP